MGLFQFKGKVTHYVGIRIRISPALGGDIEQLCRNCTTEH